MVVDHCEDNGEARIVESR